MFWAKYRLEYAGMQALFILHVLPEQGMSVTLLALNFEIYLTEFILVSTKFYSFIVILRSANKYRKHKSSMLI